MCGPGHRWVYRSAVLDQILIFVIPFFDCPPPREDRRKNRGCAPNRLSHISVFSAIVHRLAFHCMPSRMGCQDVWVYVAPPPPKNPAALFFFFHFGAPTGSCVQLSGTQACQAPQGRKGLLAPKATRSFGRDDARLSLSPSLD